MENIGDDQYSDEEATRRMNVALRRALTMPPKPHDQMTLGKTKGAPKKHKERPPSKGRVHKGRTRS